MKTFMQTKETVERKWYVIDAADKPLGRVATKSATSSRGKHKATFTQHIDCGENVMNTKADKVKLTGNKINDKMYYNHSGFPGGLRTRNAKTMLESYPVEMVERAVNGMLPNGPLGRQMYRKLFVYAGSEHKHEAQKPTTITID